MQEFALNHPYLIPLLPLLGAVLAGFLCTGKRGPMAHWPVWLGMLAAAVVSFSIVGKIAGKVLVSEASEHSTTSHVAAGEHEAVAGEHEAGAGHGAMGPVAPTTAEAGHMMAATTQAAAEEHPTPTTQGSLTARELEELGDSLSATAPTATGQALHALGISSETSTGERKSDGQPGTYIVKWFSWIHAGPFNADVSFLLDPLTAVMLAVVTGIGFLIAVFAKGYMHGESGYFRFFAYVGLFLFSMTMLVMGDNLILLYLGWEGVGLCSYLLIGYYYDTPAARDAAKKAFLVNRIGDFGFGLGIMLLFSAFGTVSYFGTGPGTDQPGFLEMATPSYRAVQQEKITAMATLGAHGDGHAAELAAQMQKDFDWQKTALAWAPFLLMLGAFGKSAQFPLYVWLPDAMAGPTPVSALIHAATMVTAGVYMIVRCGSIFYGSPAAMTLVAIVGCFTAVFSGLIAFKQYDLKKVFAYSTVSQLGFMFVGVAALAPVAGIFHLVTHAFFKALLFLCSGVVMHATFGELDMRKMSGLKKYLPKTRWLMLIGCAALAGFPGTAGFFSKDEILLNAWQQSPTLGVIMIFAAVMTAYYTFRLYYRVFHGPEVIPQPQAGHGHGGGHDDHAHGHDVHGPVAHAAADDAEEKAVVTDDHGHADHGHHNHEPAIMILPLAILALGALFAGVLLGHEEILGRFLGGSASLQMGIEQARHAYGESHVHAAAFGQHEAMAEASSAHQYMMYLSGGLAIAGILLARYMHLTNRSLNDRLSMAWAPVVRVLENKFYVDELYQAVIVNPLRGLGRVLFMIDRMVVDGIVWLIGFVPQLLGFSLKLTTQCGSLQGYALTMLLGIVVVLLLVFVR